MKKAFWALMVAVPLAMAACETTNETTDATTDTMRDATTQGDQTPACTATATNVYDGCQQFRATLCNRLVDCETYANMTECLAWFESEDGFGGCDSTFTDPVADAAKFQTCICDSIPETPCASFTDLETAIPACYEWVPQQ